MGQLILDHHIKRPFGKDIYINGPILIECNSHIANVDGNIVI